MHLPPYNAELRPEVLNQFIKDNPLGLITTTIPSSSYPTLQSSHIPWVIDSSEESRTKLGKLRGHLARPNPQSKAIIEHLSQSSDGQILQEDVLVVFMNPTHHYVTPKFYIETKPATGKVVPTWNYESVQVYGRATIYADTKSEELGKFLNRHLRDLSDHAEKALLRSTESLGDAPWEISDAPVSYIELMKKNLIGIEIEIESMAGRFKMSQEKERGDRSGVIEGFSRLDSYMGTEISKLMTERAAEYEAAKEKKKQADV